MKVTSSSYGLLLTFLIVYCILNYAIRRKEKMSRKERRGNHA